MRSYLCVTVIALLLFVFVGCVGNSSGNAHLTGKQVKSVVSQLNEIDRYDGYETNFTEVKTINSIKIYGGQKEKDKLELYLWDMSGSYIKYDGAAYKVAGGCYPIIINARLDGEEIHVAGLKVSEYGIDYADSIKKLFPEKYAKKILEEGIETCDKLEHEQEKQIKDYWDVKISEDHFALDAQTGRVVIVRSVEGYDEDGEYFFDKKVVKRGIIKKGQGGD